jgi:hypothetical protein
MANIIPFETTPEDRYRLAHDIDEAEHPIWPHVVVVAGIVCVCVMALLAAI